MIHPTDHENPQPFDRLPARYDRISELLGAELRAWLLFHLPARGDRALDLGCGTGRPTVLLADHFAEVLAVDISAPMVDFARQRHPRANITYQHRDLRSVAPERDGRFDLIFSAGALHHASPLDAALRRIQLLLQPGGRLLIADVVDERPVEGLREWVPPSRSQLRGQAWRTFGAEVRRRRRPAREALEVLRLQLDPDWLDLRSGDRPLPAEEWETTCRAVFPGVSILSLAGHRAAAWPA